MPGYEDKFKQNIYPRVSYRYFGSATGVSPRRNVVVVARAIPLKLGRIGGSLISPSQSTEPKKFHFIYKPMFRNYGPRNKYDKNVLSSVSCFFDSFVIFSTRRTTVLCMWCSQFGEIIVNPQ